jgi:hypothetical protein
MPGNLEVFTTQFLSTAFNIIGTLKVKVFNQSLEVSINWHKFRIFNITKATFAFILDTTIQTHNCILTNITLPRLFLRCHHTKANSALRVTYKIGSLDIILPLVFARRSLHK